MAMRVVLTVKGGKLDGQEYVFEEPGTCLVGRGGDCDLRLPNELAFQDVSRRHCVLEIDPPRVRVRDCGSHNGTRVNGMQIGFPAHWGLPPGSPPVTFHPYDLHPGDELRLAGTTFGVSVEPLPEGSEALTGGAGAEAVPSCR
jgi:eukaryotic-like serine/threonine-protein kinase